MEINGYDATKGRQALVYSFGLLKDDGTTACGSWIYTGYYSNTADPACKAPHQGNLRDRQQLQLVLGLALEPAHRLQPRLR
jgi:hypothetical protein